MIKIERHKVFAKCNGDCAYCGKPLDDKWQVDHLAPVYLYRLLVVLGDPNDFNNLLPACRRCNHYKRGDELPEFRKKMMTFHLRLAKLPKNTQRPQTQRRKQYMEDIAWKFGITVDRPFSGVFYFEKNQGENDERSVATDALSEVITSATKK